MLEEGLFFYDESEATQEDVDFFIEELHWEAVIFGNILI